MVVPMKNGALNDTFFRKALSQTTLKTILAVTLSMLHCQENIRRKEEIAMKKKERVWELGQAPLDSYEDQKPSIEDNFMVPN